MNDNKANVMNQWEFPMGILPNDLAGTGTGLRNIIWIFVFHYFLAI